MMNIKIIVVEKNKREYQNLIQEYIKRLKCFVKIDFVVVNSGIGKNKELVKKQEAERILKYFDKDSFIISLDEKGEMLSSENFSKKLDTIASQFNKIIFVIGGAFGLDDEVLNNSHFILSLSRMTFTHQMVRIFLLEQIYRAFQILKNKPYHK